MKLYTVTVELTAMVLAKSPEDAKRIAEDQRAIHDDVMNVFREDYECRETRGCLQGGYEKDSLVYNELKKDITFDEAVELSKVNP